MGTNVAHTFCTWERYLVTHCLEHPMSMDIEKKYEKGSSMDERTMDVAVGYRRIFCPLFISMWRSSELEACTE